MGRPVRLHSPGLAAALERGDGVRLRDRRSAQPAQSGLYVTAPLFVVAWATSETGGSTSAITGCPGTTGSRCCAPSRDVDVPGAGHHHRPAGPAGCTSVSTSPATRGQDTRQRICCWHPHRCWRSPLVVVLLAVGSMAKGFVNIPAAYTNARPTSRALTRNSCAMADEVLVGPTSTPEYSRRPRPDLGKCGPLGGEKPIASPPTASATTSTPSPVHANPEQSATTARRTSPTSGSGSPAEPAAATDRSASTDKVFPPFGQPRPPRDGQLRENTLAAKATSACSMNCPLDHRTVRSSSPQPVLTGTPTTTGSSHYGQSLKLQWGVRRSDGTFPGAGQGLSHRHPGAAGLAQPPFPAQGRARGSQRGADRRRRPHLSSEQWFGFTPPRVPILQTAQQFLGTRNPVLMDIASAAHFPKRPVLRTSPASPRSAQYRILPNLKQVVVSSFMWQSARARRPFLFIQALQSTSTVPTYLSDDWYRDWGAIERYIRVVPAAQSPTPSSEQGATGFTDGAATDRSGRCPEMRCA